MPIEVEERALERDNGEETILITEDKIQIILSSSSSTTTTSCIQKLFKTHRLIMTSSRLRGLVFPS